MKKIFLVLVAVSLGQAVVAEKVRQRVAVLGFKSEGLNGSAGFVFSRMIESSLDRCGVVFVRRGDYSFLSNSFESPEDYQMSAVSNGIEGLVKGELLCLSNYVKVKVDVVDFINLETDSFEISSSSVDTVKAFKDLSEKVASRLNEMFPRVEPQELVIEKKVKKIVEGEKYHIWEIETGGVLQFMSVHAYVSNEAGVYDSDFVALGTRLDFMFRFRRLSLVGSAFSSVIPSMVREVKVGYSGFRAGLGFWFLRDILMLGVYLTGVRKSKMSYENATFYSSQITGEDEKMSGEIPSTSLENGFLARFKPSKNVRADLSLTGTSICFKISYSFDLSKSFEVLLSSERFEGVDDKNGGFEAGSIDLGVVKRWQW